MPVLTPPVVSAGVFPPQGTQVRRNRAGQLSMASGGVVRRTSDDGGGAQPLLDAGELSDSCSQVGVFRHCLHFVLLCAGGKPVTCPSYRRRVTQSVTAHHVSCAQAVAAAIVNMAGSCTQVHSLNFRT